MMNPTPVTPSDSSCVFGGYTGCLDGEFGLSAFTGSDMSSSVSSSASSDSDASLKDGNVNDVNDPPSSSRLLQYTVVLQHVGDEALQLYLEDRPTTVVNQSKFSQLWPPLSAVFPITSWSFCRRSLLPSPWHLLRLL